MARRDGGNDLDTHGRLLHRAAAGDSDAFAHLVQRHHDRLVSRLRGRGVDRNDIDDVAQDVWVRALAGAAQHDPARPVWPWLRTIADNLLVDRARARRREVTLDVIDLADPEPTVTIEDREIIAQALAGITDRQRDLIVLIDVDEVEQVDAAAQLGITYTAMRVRLHRARTALRGAYDRLLGLPALLWVRLTGDRIPPEAVAAIAGVPLAVGLCLIALPASHSPTLPGTDTSRSVDIGPGGLRSASLDGPSSSAPPGDVVADADAAEVAAPAGGVEGDGSQAGWVDRQPSAVRHGDVTLPGGSRLHNQRPDGQPAGTVYSVPATGEVTGTPLHATDSLTVTEPAHQLLCEPVDTLPAVACTSGR